MTKPVYLEENDSAVSFQSGQCKIRWNVHKLSVQFAPLLPGAQNKVHAARHVVCTASGRRHIESCRHQVFASIFQDDTSCFH